MVEATKQISHDGMKLCYNMRLRRIHRLRPFGDFSSGLRKVGEMTSRGRCGFFI